MSFERVSSADARAIPGAKIYLFSDREDRKVSIQAGQYYRIVADSPDSGVVISDTPIDGFAQAEYNCRVGKVSGVENCATCIFPNPFG